MHRCVVERRGDPQLKARIVRAGHRAMRRADVPCHDRGFLGRSVHRDVKVRECAAKPIEGPIREVAVLRDAAANSGIRDLQQNGSGSAREQDRVGGDIRYTQGHASIVARRMARPHAAVPRRRRRAVVPQTRRPSSCGDLQRQMSRHNWTVGEDGVIGQPTPTP